MEEFIDRLPAKPIFDLVITSPPYNIGKPYERKRKALARYFLEQRKIIQGVVARLKTGGSICWQVGNYVHRGEILPLDLEFHKIFRKLGLKLRNRIVWQFGHGLHGKRRFSGRYEVVLWYTKGDRYKFSLNAVRVDSKYPGKRSYKGRNKGKFSSHPRGKNPEDVWAIPNVKGNHVEKTIHPCQFPVGLAERLVLALTRKGDLVFDPFCGVASAGVAAVHHCRRFIGCEQVARYVQVGRQRLVRASKGEERFRPHYQPIYDHTKSKLSIPPKAAERRRMTHG
ncbi:MAG: site-specific DNA-methyltransferase [Candidatus Binatia bacterium]